MDFSKFSDPAFNMKEWVNKALESEQNTNALVMKLQLIMQEVNTSLESTTLTLLNDIPRVVAEVNALNNETQLLKNQMNLVKSDINKVVKDTSDSMATVVKLDKVKDRMCCTIQKLKQADNWSLLNDEIDELFEEQEDLVSLSEKLYEMQMALGALTNLPDFYDRQNRYNNLANKLEAMISPKLIAALSSHDKEQVSTYYKIFRDVNREDEFYNYYYRTHRTSVSKILTATREDSFDAWIPVFYGKVLEDYLSERQWCKEIFETYSTVTMVLLTHSLSNTDLEHDVNNFIADSDSPIEAVATIISILKKFLMSIDKEVSSVSEGYDQLVKTIIAPYHKHLYTYGDKLKTSLLRYMNSLVTRLKRSNADTVREVEGSCKKLTSRVYDAMATCLTLTNGNAALDVIAAIEFYLGLFYEKLTSLIKDMSSLYCRDESANKNVEDHWVIFQSCFKLLQVLGDLYNDVGNMEKSFIADIQDHVRQNDTLCHYLFGEDKTESLQYLEEIRSGDRREIFTKTLEAMKQPINLCNKLCVDLVLCNVKSYLHSVHLSEEWVKKEGPVFTPSPLTYITTLGDYLLLLPQQLEPFVAEGSHGIDTALSLVNFSEFTEMNEDVEGDAFAWLTCVCQSTLFTLVEMILRIPKLSSVGCKQLAADVNYISNVMAALEVPLSRDVIDIAKLLSVTPEMCLSEETKEIPKYLCSKISAMRNASL